MKNLAEIVSIKSVEPIKDADRIERIFVKGWTVIARKGLYNAGDLAAFIYPDTMVSKRFLDETYEGDEMLRLKTVKMKGVFSAGLLVPMLCIPNIKRDDGVYMIDTPNGAHIFKEGDDIAEILGVTKYIKEIPATMSGEAKGNFPVEFISKTDEDNLRSTPEAVDELEKYPGEMSISLKYDGTSVTYILFEGEFRVCSRNLELKESESSIYWKIAKRYNIKERLQAMTGDWCIQGEIYGNGIQGNPLKQEDVKLAVFHVKDLTFGKLLDVKEMQMFCDLALLPMVEIIGYVKTRDFIDSFKSGELQKVVNMLKYAKDTPAEGAVFKTVNLWPSYAFNKEHWSGKLISEAYLD